MILRPFAWIGGSVATVFLVAPFCSDSVVKTMIAVTFSVGTAMLCVRRFRRCQTAWAALFCIGAAFFFYHAYDCVITRPLQRAVGTQVSVVAAVCDLPEAFDKSVRYELAVQDGDLPRGTHAYYYDTSRGETLSPGDTVRGTFTVYPVCDPEDTVGTLYAQASGVWLYLQSTSEQPAVIASTQTHLSTALLRFRLSVRQALSVQFSRPIAGTITAIGFGDRDALPDEISSAYRATGLSHVLAVSGLHLTVVTGAVYALLRRRLKPRTTALWSIGFVLLFMAITGFPPSVVRAGVMTVIVLIGRLLHRESDGFNAVGLAVTILSIVRPTAVWDVGLQLSVCATIGLLEWYPRLSAAWQDFLWERVDITERRWYFRLLSNVGNGFCVTVCATLPTLVPMMVYYGEISLIAPLANLVVVPVATVSVCLGLIVGLMLGVGIFPAWLTDIFSLFAGLSVQTQHALVRLLQRISLPSWEMNGWYLVVWAVGVLAVWCIVRRQRIRTAYLALGCAVCLLVGSLFAPLVQPETRRIALAVGEDTAVCLSHRDETVVIASLQQEDAVYRLQEALERNRIRRLTALVLTDADGEGVRHLYRLCTHVSVEKIYLPTSGTHLPQVYTTVASATLTDDAQASLGDGGRFIRFDGFVGVEWQGNTVLVCHDAAASAVNLPVRWRRVQTAVCRDAPPESDALIFADEWVTYAYRIDKTTEFRTTAYGVDCVLKEEFP